MLSIRIVDASLSVDELERVLRHLDQLWAVLAQVVDYALPGRRPVPRGQVRRPAVGRVGLQPPHDVTFHDAEPPAPAEMWTAYRDLLRDPDGAAERLTDWIAARRETWTAEERQRRDGWLATAIAPSSGAPRRAEDDDVLPRLIRRACLHGTNVWRVGVRIVVGGPVGTA